MATAVKLTADEPLKMPRQPVEPKEHETSDGGDVLPGYRVRVADLFDGLLGRPGSRT